MEMSTFYHKIEKPGSNYSVVVEDDGKVAYAYLLYGQAIVGDVWLYNQQETPEQPEWRDKSRTPFLNPKSYVKPVNFAPLIDAKDVQAIWHEAEDGIKAVELHLRGQHFALISPGNKPGFSFLAVKDGPLAKVLK